MSTSQPTLIQRLNEIADELEKKAKQSKTPDGKTLTEALDRVAKAVEKL